jgi:hypothetical protein
MIGQKQRSCGEQRDFHGDHREPVLEVVAWKTKQEEQTDRENEHQDTEDAFLSPEQEHQRDQYDSRDGVHNKLEQHPKKGIRPIKGIEGHEDEERAKQENQNLAESDSQYHTTTSSTFIIVLSGVIATKPKQIAVCHNCFFTTRNFSFA